MKRHRIHPLPGAAALASLLWAGSAVAQPVGQWDFTTPNLNATVGSPLTFKDAGTQAGTQFGTTTSFGIPDIGGAVANVMQFPAGADASAGFSMVVTAGPNGGGGLVNDWTLIMDVLFPEASSSKLRALIETDEGLFNADAEFWVTAANAFGLKGSAAGVVAPNTWHRLAVVVDGTRGRIRVYVDGTEVRSESVSNLLDGRYALSPGGFASLFSDDSGETAQGYVNSIQLRDAALTKGQVLAFGGPTAAGVDQVLPPVPSGVDRWIPSGEFASRTTPVGAVISTGSSTVADSSIVLKLDGATIASPSISRATGEDGDLITVRSTPATPFVPGTEHTISVTYTDSRTGEKTLTRTFTAAVFYEDFEGIALGPNKDEGLAGETVWTNTPPAGWSLNNDDFLAVVISPENPDDDGDGFADQDGVTEWAGWGFANKDWWVQAAGNQRRAEFAFGEGTVAIADPDEWDDSSHVPALFNSYLKSPEISLEGLAPGSAFLKFASSWRPEGFDDPNAGRFLVNEDGTAKNNQTAIITASYDGGAPVQILKWDSQEGSPTFHADFPNETVLVQLNNPAGARKVVLSFEMRLGANDWWWAVDNIVVNAGAQPPVITGQPAGIEVLEGQPVTLTVAASGEGLTYQWFKGQGTGRTPINGATGASYTIPAAQLADNGYYSVDVKNSVGTTPSSAALVSVQLDLTGKLTLLSENFDGLALGPNVDEALAGDAVWTKTAPAGWVIDDTGVPGVGTDEDGVTEWAGWSFADRAWWAEAGGNQRRAEFLKGTGAIAVADSDEWDDIAHAAGNMNTFLTTKPISLAGVKAGSVGIKFDSSWRPEEPQRATVAVSFDGGPATVVYEFNSSQSSPNFHPDAVNETLSIPVNNPAGAANMTVIFGYLETRNNWWWAFDNLVVAGSKASVFSENFESLVLGPNIEEGIITGAGTPPAQPREKVWTKTPPTGWVQDDTGVPGVGTDQDGVTEWAGWSFADRAWWATTAGNQRRAEFLKGTGAIAIADSDEWDDVPHAAGNMATFLTTPSINITGETANALYLKFDSSWRPEEPQKATITVSYDGAAATEVLRWESAGPLLHPDSVDETVTIPLYNPAGAKAMKITFGYFDTRNNWWWAFDNVEVNVGPVAPPLTPELSFSTDANGNLVITFTGVLQSSTSLGGQFNTVQGATSPYTVPADGPAVNFYRSAN